MLRDYQIDISTQAAIILREYRLVYFSMQVRTGKTLTALATAKLYGATSVLFLTKKKAITSILKDYDALQPGYSITVNNYEQIKNITGTFDMVILDEAHCLGQYPSPAKKIKLLKDRLEMLPIIYLSGTPTPESYSQIYHQFYVSSYSPFIYYRNFYAWARDYVTTRVRYVYGRAMNDYSHANELKIKNATRHLFLSYTQQEAGFTQDVHETVLTVEMKKQTLLAANKLKADKVLYLKNNDHIVADTAVKLMQKLHQLYSGTCITETDQRLLADDSKAHFIYHRFKGQKVAIFYKFKAELDLLKRYYGEAITDDPDAFRKNMDLTFVCQIQSGREGINLATADALVMFNIDFSSVSYQQARARIQSKDRTAPCHLYWIFADGGIEQRIYKRVINKQDYTLSYFKKDYL